MDDTPREESEEPAERSLLRRLHRSLGPLAGGLVLDLVDLLTPGPVGLFGGFVIGALAGWWVSSLYGWSTRGRLFFSALALVYVALPLTGILPLATLVAALARFQEEDPRGPRPSEPERPNEPPGSGPRDVEAQLVERPAAAPGDPEGGAPSGHLGGSQPPG